jgi:hypothetical protein
MCAAAAHLPDLVSGHVVIIDPAVQRKSFKNSNASF